MFQPRNLDHRMVSCQSEEGPEKHPMSRALKLSRASDPCAGEMVKFEDDRSHSRRADL